MPERLTPKDRAEAIEDLRELERRGIQHRTNNLALDLLDERDTLRDELRNIANAKPSEWEPDVRDQFQQWAQNRARHTLSTIDRAGGGS